MVVSAQGLDPERSITFIVPQSAGNPNDTIARIVTERLADVLKTPTILDNPIGAGGNIGTSLAAKAKPDGRDDLGNDPAYAYNDGRATNAAVFDVAIGEWTSKHLRAEVLAALVAADVPAESIYTVADIVSDPQYLVRQMIVDTPTSDGKPLKGRETCPSFR